MKIYLAGKVDAEHGSWRDAILGSEYNRLAGRVGPRWELVRDFNLEYQSAGDALDPPSWPSMPNKYVLGIHDYVGPYRTTYPLEAKDPDTKQWGYFHGTTWVGCHGYMEPADQKIVVTECLRAIDRSDFVFAFINSPDCFATLAEIGYARAKGIHTYVVVDDSATWDSDDYWFVCLMVNGWSPLQAYERQHSRSIQDCFRDALVEWTGRPPRPAPLSIAQPAMTNALYQELVAYGESFYQITRWTSDPRVRNEAAKMVERVRQAVGR